MNKNGIETDIGAIQGGFFFSENGTNSIGVQEILDYESEDLA